MNRREIERLDRDLSGFIESMIADMGRPERRRAMKWYIVGLLLDGERKSIEPMAARLVDSDSEIEAMRQRLQQAVSEQLAGLPDDGCTEEATNGRRAAADRCRSTGVRPRGLRPHRPRHGGGADP